MAEDRISTFINKLFAGSVKIIGMVIIFYLFTLSIFSTSIRSVRNYSGNMQEQQWGRYIYFLADSPLKHIILLMFLVGVLVAIRFLGFQNKYWQKRKTYKQQVAVCIIYFCLLLFYILNTQFYPKSDPSKMLRIADEIMNHDYHEFLREGYLYRYPYQSGFILYCMIFLKVFRQSAFVVLQIMNAIGLSVMFYLIGRCMKLMWGINERQVAYATAVCMLCSLPLFFYTTFIYGNLPGMAFSVAAIWLELLFLKKRNFITIFASSICIAIAIVMKSNCSIFLIAMYIILLLDMLQSEKRKLSLAACILMPLLCFILNTGTLLIMERMTGQELSKGMPKSAFIMMGLEEGSTAPGTENGSSNRIFEKNSFEYGATDAAAKEEIYESLKNYVKNIEQGINFFGRKQAAQCNEPTFQCFSITTDRETKIAVPKWIQYMISGEGSLWLTEILNIIQTMILFGTCAYIVSFKTEKRNFKDLIFLLIFIGGFIFQLLWEAKSQYMLIFFFILLPYAVQGYRILTDKFFQLFCIIKDKKVIAKQKRTYAIAIFATLLCIILGGFFMQTKAFGYIIAIRSEEEVLREYFEVVESIQNKNS